MLCKYHTHKSRQYSPRFDARFKRALLRQQARKANRHGHQNNPSNS